MNALREMNREENMKTYRKHMVMLLCGLAERAEVVTDNEYSFDGELPAVPELYDKEDWEDRNETIEQIVLNYFIPELWEAIEATKKHEYTKLDQLNNIKDILTDIDWSEV